LKTVGQWAAEIDRDLRLNLDNGHFQKLCDLIRHDAEREARRLFASGRDAVLDELRQAFAA
jgi:hypothetical protein